jgi:hypothetical protein
LTCSTCGFSVQPARTATLDIIVDISGSTRPDWAIVEKNIASLINATNHGTQFSIFLAIGADASLERVASGSIPYPGNRKDKTGKATSSREDVVKAVHTSIQKAKLSACPDQAPCRDTRSCLVDAVGEVLRQRAAASPVKPHLITLVSDGLEDCEESIAGMKRRRIQVQGRQLEEIREESVPAVPRISPELTNAARRAHLHIWIPRYYSLSDGRTMSTQIVELFWRTVFKKSKIEWQQLTISPNQPDPAIRGMN